MRFLWSLYFVSAVVLIAAATAQVKSSGLTAPLTFPCGADGTDKCTGRFGRHRFRQTHYSTLGGLLDALEIGRTVEDSLSPPANR